RRRAVVIGRQAVVAHVLPSRPRQLTRWPDEATETSAPAETWDAFQAWLYRRVAEDVVQTYTFLHRRAQELAARVGEHFGEDGGEIAVDLDVVNPTEALAAVDADTDVELSKKIGRAHV